MAYKSKKMNTEDILKWLEKLTNEVRNTRATNDKKEVLKKYYEEDKNLFKDVMTFLFDTDYKYNVTPSNIKKFRKNKKYDETPGETYKHLYDLLVALKDRKITGHTALKSTSEFINQHKKYEDILFKIIAKKPEMSVGKTIVNKVMEGKNKISKFAVALANKYTDKIMERYKDDDWYISRKYDGVRIIAHVNPVKETIRYYSRIGKENKLLDFLTGTVDFKKLRSKGLKDPFYLDGEIIYLENSNEDFKKIMQVIKNPERDQSKLRYVIFDFLTEKEFTTKKGDDKLTERLERIKKYLGKGNGVFTPIKYYKYNEKNYTKLLDESSEKGWEGLMLRRDAGYEGKRSNDLLKVKKFHDAEFKVLEVLPTEKVIIKDGKEVKTKMLGSVVIDFEGVKVGSGFSDDERIYYYKHPEEIIGKVITVQYFEKTPDGKLRFPTLKFIHGKKREY